jgi:hypothetical protein
MNSPLQHVSVTSVNNGEKVDLGQFLQDSPNKTMVVFATYAGDFNAIEYVQRVRYYLPQLYQRGITRIGLIVNAEAQAAKLLVDLVQLRTDADSDFIETQGTPMVHLFVDPSGNAGRKFGVARGWRPDDEQISPYVKLFAMLFGLGAWATLPAVISGYIGNPFFGQPWIEDALAVGQSLQRWPDTALVLEEGENQQQSLFTDGEVRKGLHVKVNKFSELPWGLGEWKRRPLELATLRLQNMLGISIKYWKELAPTEDALKDGVLTQLGGCLVVDSSTDSVLYKWRDPGICAVANFEDLLRRIPVV